MGHVCSARNFRHLERLEDGAMKAEEARRAVEALREHYEGHAGLAAERTAFAARKQERDRALGLQEQLDRKLAALRDRFLGAQQADERQRRGYELEGILRELFALYDLDPKASFRPSAEQIDGAFSFEGTDYLLEARWRQAQADSADLDVLEGKIGRKLDNTLGLFVSIAGFSQEAIDTHSGTRPRIILMDGTDLWAMLEGRIALPEALRRKRRHAARFGEIMLSVLRMLGSPT